MVVRPESATIGVSGERAVPLNGNHVEIPKCFSTEDEKYVTISGHILRMYNGIRQREDKT
jgi:hypothetical protein